MRNQLIEDCVFILEQGKVLLHEIEGKDFYQTIGAHFRHCLDFIECLILGIEIGKIDYNKRTRDLRTETDCRFAGEKIDEIIGKLYEISASDINKSVLVRHERASDLTKEESWCGSSVARELEFMQSHTVHHFAIIKLKLAFEGIRLNDDFGVAASTLKYKKQSV